MTGPLDMDAPYSVVLSSQFTISSSVGASIGNKLSRKDKVLKYNHLLVHTKTWVGSRLFATWSPELLASRDGTLDIQNRNNLRQPTNGVRLIHAYNYGVKASQYQVRNKIDRFKYLRPLWLGRWNFRIVVNQLWAVKLSASRKTQVWCSNRLIVSLKR